MTTSDKTRLAGAADVMRSLGLLVDGPARWATPVPSRKPGVFVVELPAAPESAPLDTVALRRWIERAGQMTLDGERPTPQALATWLERFWLPREPVLYVGRSTKAIGARVAAIHATPLGDAKPSSAAHWLKALANQAELRIWWAETDAHEEYEDALLAEVTSRSGGLPFANMATPDGHVKAAGLVNGLTAAPDEPSTAKPASGTVVPKRRAATRRAAASPRPPRTPVQPQIEPTYLSRDGLERLTAELDELRTTVRPQVIARVKSARELGDLRENGDYEYARKEQSFVEGRILALEQMIKHSVIVDESVAGGAARIGSTLVVEADGEEQTYTIVGSAEADPSGGRISNVSPVGRALVGARAGDEVVVQLPMGDVSYRVREVR